MSFYSGNTTLTDTQVTQAYDRRHLISFLPLYLLLLVVFSSLTAWLLSMMYEWAELACTAQEDWRCAVFDVLWMVILFLSPGLSLDLTHTLLKMPPVKTTLVFTLLLIVLEGVVYFWGEPILLWEGFDWLRDLAGSSFLMDSTDMLQYALTLILGICIVSHLGYLVVLGLQKGITALKQRRTRSL